MLETWLSSERSYSARQLSQLLASQRQVELRAEQVRRILLKKNGVGKGRGKKPPKSPNPNYKQAKKTDWSTLKLWAEEKLITLLYLDESGCCLESPLSFGYS